MGRIQRFGSEGEGDPELASPPPGRILSGSPSSRTWNAYTDEEGRVFCGIWESTPGRWRVAYDEWESCTILQGRSIVTPDTGEPVELRPGDTLVLEPGFEGTWEVVETTRKSYVIRV